VIVFRIFIWYYQSSCVRWTFSARVKEINAHKSLVKNLFKNICWKQGDENRLGETVYNFIY
jgi:hypothetical protein